MPINDQTGSFPDTCQRVRGFSLIELLLALVLGSMLVTALASATQVIAKQVEYVRPDSASQAERALALLSNSVRSGWTVEKISATRLSITDVYGNATDYFLENGALRVTRPSGATGDLVSDVASLSFDIQTTQRLREATPLGQYGVLSTVAEPSGTQIPITLPTGSAIAFGFTAPLAAPSSVETVPGVTEELISTTLERLLIPIAWLDRGLNEFCHLHASQPHSPNHDPADAGALTIELYEAQVAGEASPYGPLLASAAIFTQTLTPLPFWWWDTEELESVEAPDPPNGVAWGWWDLHEHVVLQTGAVPSTSALDVAGLGAALEPGRAYTVVLRVTGLADVQLRAVSIGSSAGSGIAIQSSGGGAFVPQALAISHILEGTRTFTQTIEQDVCSRVTVSVVLSDGRTVSGSASVLSQLGTDDPWLGVVPGERPVLEQAGL